MGTQLSAASAESANFPCICVVPLCISMKLLTHGRKPDAQNARQDMQIDIVILMHVYQNLSLLLEGNWLAGRLVGWLAGKLIGRQTGWLAR